MLYGTGSTLLAYSIVRSGYLPKSLGVLLALGGIGVIAMNFTLVLGAANTTNFLLLPTTLAMLLQALWFLVRGVDVGRWERRAAASEIGG